MCDNDVNGEIDKEELTKMLRSLVDIAKANSLTEHQTMEIIQGMFATAGLENKDRLDYTDFKAIMKEYRGDFIAIGLDCKGTLMLLMLGIITPTPSNNIIPDGS